MRTFIELKEISLKKEYVDSSDFPENGFYKLHRKGEIEIWDLVYVQKELPHVMFICPIDVFDKLNLEIPKDEITCKYNESKEKTTEEKKHPALLNFEKTELPKAELISEGMVSADFVLEFAKILLSKK